MIKEKSYFYKADDFPEVVVNKSGKIKSLAESCQITLPKPVKMVKCPYCDGEGGYWTEHDFYPPGLPDSGWAHDYKRIYIKCSHCHGTGEVREEDEE